MIVAYHNRVTMAVFDLSNLYRMNHKASYHVNANFYIRIYPPHFCVRNLMHSSNKLSSTKTTNDEQMLHRLSFRASIHSSLLPLFCLVSFSFIFFCQSFVIFIFFSPCKSKTSSCPPWPTLTISELPHLQAEEC